MSFKENLEPLITDYIANLSSDYAKDAIQREILAHCYQNRSTDGDHTGGKSGSLCFNINPTGTDEQSEAQRKLFSDTLNTVKQMIQTQSHSLHPQPLFEWNGSHLFQIKPDSTAKTEPLVREELNENVAELLVTCLSDSFHTSYQKAGFNTHPNSFVFTSATQETLIASQYLSDTIGDLAGFIKQCIISLREMNLDTDLKEKYRDFSLDTKENIRFVDSVATLSASDRHQSIELSDIDTLASLFVAHKKQSGETKYQDLDDQQNLKRRLLEEVSFSHLIADHDVNPGNFIVRFDGSKQLGMSRIDFGMSNYHFTRGRIYGISRRPFKNVIFDIPKESLTNFIERKNIGFGLKTFLPNTVSSKTWEHLSGLTALLKNHHLNGPDQIMIKDIMQQNQNMHQFLESESTRNDIQKRFFEKTAHLPPKNLAKIAKDIKIMELQSIRTSYLDKRTFKSTALSLLKAISMVSLTPILTVLHLSINIPLVLINLIRSRLKLPSLHNPIPITTWSMINQIQLYKTYHRALEDRDAAQKEISQSLDHVLANIAGDNKAHFIPQVAPLYSIPAEQVNNEAILSSTVKNTHEKKPSPSNAHRPRS